MFESDPRACSFILDSRILDTSISSSLAWSQQSTGWTIKVQNFQGRTIFFTMMKLRCSKSDTELSIMFGIWNSTVSQVFSTMIRFLFYHLKDMTPWLPKDAVELFTPLDFKSKYSGTRVILDGTEFFVQKPSVVQDQSATWSSYKNHSTLKSMIGISPRGVVTHVSQTYGGCTSDRQIIERSDLVKKGMFEKGNSIMADRGIMVQDIFACIDVKVNTPTMLRG